MYFDTTFLSQDHQRQFLKEVQQQKFEPEQDGYYVVLYNPIVKEFAIIRPEYLLKDTRT